MPTFTLKHPIKTSDGRTITELELRDITIGDIAEAQKGNKTGLEADLKLVELLATDLAPEDIRKLRTSDYNIVSEYIGKDFLD